METVHRPVMVEEVLNYLDIKKNHNYIDGTAGGGGHLTEIARLCGPRGKVIGFDKDEEACTELKKRFSNKDQIEIIHKGYEEIQDYISEKEGLKISGILLDLGYSSDQLERRGRGFSFQRDEVLDMRFDQGQELSAAKILQTYSEDGLMTLFRRYGQEQYARSIARSIVDERKVNEIQTTNQLVDIIKRSVPHKYRIKKRHPATKVFQALRIEVNKEFDVIERGLEVAIDALEVGGRLVVITFHSLEDKLVKDIFKHNAHDCICPINFPECRCDHEQKVILISRKSIKPSQAEIAENPRARSAQLRVVEKI